MHAGCVLVRRSCSPLCCIQAKASSPPANHAPSASPNIFGKGIDLFAHPNDAPATSMARQASIGALSRALSQEGSLPPLVELDEPAEQELIDSDDVSTPEAVEQQRSVIHPPQSVFYPRSVSRKNKGVQDSKWLRQTKLLQS